MRSKECLRLQKKAGSLWKGWHSWLVWLPPRSFIYLLFTFSTPFFFFLEEGEALPVFLFNTGFLRFVQISLTIWNAYEYLIKIDFLYMDNQIELWVYCLILTSNATSKVVQRSSTKVWLTQRNKSFNSLSYTTDTHARM